MTYTCRSCLSIRSSRPSATLGSSVTLVSSTACLTPRFSPGYTSVTSRSSSSCQAGCTCLFGPLDPVAPAFPPGPVESHSSSLSVEPVEPVGCSSAACLILLANWPGVPLGMVEPISKKIQSKKIQRYQYFLLFWLLVIFIISYIVLKIQS